VSTAELGRKPRRGTRERQEGVANRERAHCVFEQACVEKKPIDALCEWGIQGPLKHAHYRLSSSPQERASRAPEVAHGLAVAGSVVLGTRDAVLLVVIVGAVDRVVVVLVRTGAVCRCGSEHRAYACVWAAHRQDSDHKSRGGAGCGDASVRSSKRAGSPWTDLATLHTDVTNEVELLSLLHYLLPQQGFSKRFSAILVCFRACTQGHKTTGRTVGRPQSASSEARAFLYCTRSWNLPMHKHPPQWNQPNIPVHNLT
jgi:hypothetical protein